MEPAVHLRFFGLISAMGKEPVTAGNLKAAERKTHESTLIDSVAYEHKEDMITLAVPNKLIDIS